ncbi:hypothetical protein PUNSTDRAFT_125363 [Punctularia strigosozonata HHB-11173 SS5]|uniref:uncharacterized protein n=1 Tax=Punctularia strigosozonata (strain HHB-11173) TaxID=741275 RepID=UPI0004417203|nr:uncharacterized protein PUNSTDRAFT_125363 [Punctularia strigosozonata HHB-11173 SS5]EIN10584.1 hypothetical protein PUNSTDRAFT_125363 [Punctularia strigosozonata HHB-11173 SS5]
MHTRWFVLGLLTLSASLVAALPSAAPASQPILRDVSAGAADLAVLGLHDLTKRDEHGHHHGAPLTELDETQILQGHAPTPPSYWTIDIDEPGDEPRYPGLMAAHALFMSLAFFGALPAGIALRSVKHAWHGVSIGLFWGFVVLGVSCSALYRKMTPNMYEGQVHSSHGFAVLLVAAVLSVIDALAFFVRLFNYLRSVRANPGTFSFKSFWRIVFLNQDEHGLGSSAEYAGLVLEEDPEELEEHQLHKLGELETVFNVDDVHDNHNPTSEWVNGNRPTVHRQNSGSSDRSRHSEETLRDPTTPVRTHFSRPRPRTSLVLRIGNGIFATMERVLVFAAWAQVTEGIVVYTGGCRQNYLNGCLAHIIKGSIFWCYGLASFARFLGAFSSMGWAWNRAPHGDRYPTAEFTECFVIFLYGATNTWMERFGAHPGDPYTTKQIQHIGIAVMFWFAGLVGMGIESKTIRRWLASGSSIVSDELSPGQAIEEPASYRASFNPFPALVIGVTGAAMAAHAQTYLFQVQIHSLWGNLLLGFSVLRCLTYFFMWLGPPRSILPSRPPTEALGSFFLACGGLAFISSTEEITLAAMRRGRDDVMMFLNVTVALTCLGFCWTLAVVLFKAWLQSRTHPAPSFRSPL